jgi:hypothetical protein
VTSSLSLVNVMSLRASGRLDTEDSEDGDPPILWDAMIDAWCMRPCQISFKEKTNMHPKRAKLKPRTPTAGLEKPHAPLDFSAPPNVTPLPVATGQGALDKPVPTEIVSVLNDLVPLLRMLLFRCSYHQSSEQRLTIGVEKRDGGMCAQHTR